MSDDRLDRIRKQVAGPYFNFNDEIEYDDAVWLIAEVERLRAELDDLLYVAPKGPGVSPVVVCRTKEGHLFNQALMRAEDDVLDATARAMRAEAELVRLRHADPPADWVLAASVPKSKYAVVATDDGWDIYTPDDHGAFS